MWNVRNRRLYPAVIIALAAASMTVASCESAAKREKASADSLVNVATELIAQRQYEEAFAVLDTLNSRFPQQIEARRTATKIQAEAMTAYSELKLNETDSLIAVLEGSLEAMKPLFTHVPGQDISGYFRVTRAHNPSFLTSTAIEARVDDDDFSYYIVAINNGPHIGINRLTLAGDGISMDSGQIAADSERSGDISADGIDMASFIPAEISGLVAWTVQNKEAVDRAIFTGKNGRQVTVRLTPEQVQSFADAQTLSLTARALQKARLDREKYQRQLLIARDHNVNL